MSLEIEGMIESKDVMTEKIETNEDEKKIAQIPTKTVQTSTK